MNTTLQGWGKIRLVHFAQSTIGAVSICELASLYHFLFAACCSRYLFSLTSENKSWLQVKLWVIQGWERDLGWYLQIHRSLNQCLPHHGSVFTARQRFKCTSYFNRYRYVCWWNNPFHGTSNATTKKHCPCICLGVYWLLFKPDPSVQRICRRERSQMLPATWYFVLPAHKGRWNHATSCVPSGHAKVLIKILAVKYYMCRCMNLKVMFIPPAPVYRLK